MICLTMCAIFIEDHAAVGLSGSLLLQVFRGHVPHFCNFVHKLQLHNKQVSSTDSTGVPDSEFADEIDLIAESVDGSLIGQWRKGSGAR